MEIEESVFLNSDCAERNRPKLLSCSKRDGAENLDKNNIAPITTPTVTEQDLCQMFENNEEHLRYYLSLKEVVLEKKRRGKIYWCDPRDLQMKERLEHCKWKPRVIFKLASETDGSEHNRCEWSSKQVIVDRNRKSGETFDTNKIAPLAASALTEQGLLQMFDNNEEYLRYYLSLKEAVLEKRRKGEIYRCDPRDLQLNERLEHCKWKPRVVLKLASDQYCSEHTKYAWSCKQVIVAKNGKERNVEEKSGETFDKNKIFPVAAPAVTEQDLLQMFENNKEHLRYYLSLKEAVLEKRRKGEICLCDPRDLHMKERLELCKWKPKVIFKVASETDGSEHSRYALSSKQVIVDKNRKEMDIEEKSGETLDTNKIAPVAASALTEQGLLQMFDNNKEHLRYYLSLKEAVLEKRRKGEICLCDPRDLHMKERLELCEWKPKVIFKVASETGASEHKKYALSSKHVIVDKNGQDNEMDHEPSNTSYESHYRVCHYHVCAECKKSFVSNFLLDIHLEENHDSYFKILCPRIDMYRCLVQSCKQKFRTPEQRKAHIFKAHGLTDTLKLHKPMRTRSRKSQTPSRSESLEHCINGNNNTNSLDIPLVPFSQLSIISLEDKASGQPPTKTVGATRESGRGVASNWRNWTVPETICFGTESQKAFNCRRLGRKKPHWYQIDTVDVDSAVDIEQIDFTDIMDCLGKI